MGKTNGGKGSEIMRTDAYRSKYNEDVISAIESEIKNLSGRINACKSAGISYETFCNWMENKPEFVERIKNAEMVSKQTGKETAILSIFNAMPKVWTAGAWWLERNFSDEFGEVSKHKHEGALPVLVVDKDGSRTPDTPPPTRSD